MMYIYVLCLAHLEEICCRLFLKTGAENKTRIVSINDIALKLAFNVINLDISIKDYLNAILGAYCVTGYDTISAMVGKGKLKALKVLSENKHSIDAFNKLG